MWAMSTQLEASAMTMTAVLLTLAALGHAGAAG